MKKNKKLIVFNWKMEPTSIKKAEKLLALIKREAIIVPPFVYLEKLAEVIKEGNCKIELGAQNCFWENEGAYTGEISPLMLKDLGVKYIIIGHSERRNYLGETDDIIARKLKAVVGNKITPILCIGETFRQRKNGLTKKVIRNQLKSDLKEVKNLKFKVRKLVIAYEPRWAIGTGHYCLPEEAARIHSYVRKFLNSANISQSRIIYGGSVNSKDVSAFLEKEEIDGVLIGHAGLNPREIKKIMSVLKNY